MNTLVLSNFSSYFSIFAVLNLGYATSKPFRDAVDDGILRMNAYKKWKENEIAQIKAKLVVGNNPSDVKLRNKIDEFNKTFDIEVDSLKEKSDKSASFINGLKTSFLCTAYYSFTFLILAGYQRVSSIGNNIIENYPIYDMLYVLNFILLIFNLLIFLRSLFKKYCSHPIKPFWITVSYLFIVLCIILTCYLFTPNAALAFAKTLDLNWSVGLGIFLALSPYLFHFLRVYIHKRHFSPMEKAFITDKELKLRDLKSVMQFLEDDLDDVLKKSINQD